MAIRKLSKSKRVSNRVSKRASKRASKRVSKRASKSKKRGSNSKKRGSKAKTRGSKVSSLNKQNNTKHRGGFFGSSNCSIASVSEPGFNLPPLTSGATQITGFSIPQQKAIIFDPQCPPPPSHAGMF